MGSKKIIQKLPWILVGIMTLLYFLQSILLHNAFLSHAWDLGLYDQQTWLYSHTFTLYNTVRGTNLLSDHFGIILYALAPFYRFWPHAETLLFAQALAVALSGYPIYRIAERLFKLPLAGIAFSLAYYLSAGVLFAIHFDFHLASVGVVFLAWFTYFLIDRKYWPALLMLVLGCLTKEDFPLYFLTFSVAFVVLKPFKELAPKTDKVIKVQKYKIPYHVIIYAALAVLSAGFFVGIMLVMNHIPKTQANFDYFSFNSLGSSYANVVKNFVFHPLAQIRTIVSGFFGNQVKTASLLNYSGGFLFLPLLAPFTYIAGFPFFLTKYVSDRPTQWGLNGQYGISGMLIMALGMILVVHYLFRRYDPKIKTLKILLGAYTVFVVIYSFQAAPDFWKVFTPNFSKTAAEFSGLKNIIRQIPPDASVAAPDQIIPHISNRRSVYIIECPLCNLPELNTDYVVLDTRLGTGFNPKADVTPLVANLENSGSYRQVIKDDKPDYTTYLLRRR